MGSHAQILKISGPWSLFSCTLTLIRKRPGFLHAPATISMSRRQFTTFQYISKYSQISIHFHTFHTFPDISPYSQCYSTTTSINKRRSQCQARTQVKVRSSIGWKALTYASTFCAVSDASFNASSPSKPPQKVKHFMKPPNLEWWAHPWYESWNILNHCVSCLDLLTFHIKWITQPSVGGWFQHTSPRLQAYRELLEAQLSVAQEVIRFSGVLQGDKLNRR